MNRTEVIKIIRLLGVNYPNFAPKERASDLVALWETMLSDVEFEVAQVAIQKYMSENKFAPTVADIREKVSEIVSPKIKTAIEAWGDVTGVIRRFGSYRQEEAMKELTGVTKEVVESIGYLELCKSENVMVDRAHFLKVYDSLADRKRKESLLSFDTKEREFALHQSRQRYLEGGP